MVAAAAAQERPPSLRRTLASPAMQVLAPVAEADRRPGASGTHRQIGVSSPSRAKQLWRQAIRSPGAVGLRVHFTGFAVGNGRVWLHDGRRFQPQVSGPYTGRGVFGDGDFWSEVLYGETVVIEYEPSGSGSFQVPEISHLWDRGILGPNPISLAAIRTVYLAPMTGGLEKLLAKELRDIAQLAVVSEPEGADAFWTEGAGTVELIAPGGRYPVWSTGLPRGASKSALERLACEIATEVKVRRSLSVR